MDYELQTLETEHQRGWQLDGQVELHNPHIGTTVTYGMRPEGYDGVVIHERRGGGAVTVPYVVEEGEPYIGLLHEERQLMGGMVWNVPRGMLQPDETHEEGALREFHEETGYLAVGRTVDLLAMEVNSNSAVFDTSREGEGIRLGDAGIRTHFEVPVAGHPVTPATPFEIAAGRKLFDASYQRAGRGNVIQ